MILSDVSLRLRINRELSPRHRSEPIVVRPYSPALVQPSSLDVRLGSKLILPLEDGTERHWDLEKDGSLSVDPGVFVLGCTLEWIEVPRDLVGILVGKSSLARRGLQVEAAGYVDPGWKGVLTLEFVVFGSRPFVFLHGMEIAQIAFHQLTTPALHPYGHDDLGSKYQGSTTTVMAR